MNRAESLPFRSLVFLASIFAFSSSGASQAEVIPQAKKGLYHVKSFAPEDAAKISEIVKSFVAESKAELIFLGESHGDPAIRQTEVEIAKRVSHSDNDCVSLELGNFDSSRALFFPLNQRKLSREQWVEIFLAHWKYVCQLLDVRFAYKGQCYSQESFEKMGHFLWDLTKDSQAKVFGHEMEMAKFHDAIYELRLNPTHSNYLRTHFLLRNEEHARNIARNYRAGSCEKMLVIEGSGHLESDFAIRQDLAKKVKNYEDRAEFPTITPVQETLARLLKRKEVFIRLNKPNDFSMDGDKADLTFVFE